MEDRIIDKLMYDCHLHEMNFDNNLHLIEVKEKRYKALGENTQIESLNEAFIDNVMEYIRKVVASMGEAFTNFQTSIKTLNANEVIDKNQKLLQGNLQMQPPADFSMPKYDEMVDFCKKQVTKEFSRDSLQYLDNESEYIAQYFDRQYAPTNDKSFKDIVNEKLFTKTTGKEIIDARQMQQYVNFCTRDFQQIANAISNNRKLIDSSSRSVDNALRQMGITEMMNYYFNEADENNNQNNTNQNNNQTNTTTNNQQEDTSKFRVVNNGDAIDRKDLANKIKKFYQYNTKILSTQMSTTNKAYRQYFTLIRTFIKFQGGQVDLKNDNNQNQNNNN